MPLFRRCDGDVVKDVPAYRRIMPFIMPTRTESAVYFEQQVDAEHALAFIQRWNDAHPDKRITFFHLLTHEVIRLLHERPRLNRFVSGGRLYQRNAIWIGFSAKKALTDDAPVVAMKRKMDPLGSFTDHVDALSAQVSEGRSDQESHVDKELKLLLWMPVFLLKFLVKVVKRLDAWNLLPRFYIDGDPLFSSVFIANLGSIKLDAAYHHNYEYGDTPVFCTIGKLHQVVVPIGEGRVGTRREVTLRWTFDERIEDGLYCARTLELLKQRLEGPRDAASAHALPPSGAPAAQPL